MRRELLCVRMCLPAGACACARRRMLVEGLWRMELGCGGGGGGPRPTWKACLPAPPLTCAHHPGTHRPGTHLTGRCACLAAGRRRESIRKVQLQAEDIVNVVQLVRAWFITKRQYHSGAS